MNKIKLSILQIMQFKKCILNIKKKKKVQYGQWKNSKNI